MRVISIERKKEIIAFYKEHGSVSTEIEYGLRKGNGSKIVSEYKRDVKEHDLGFRSMAKFIKSASDGTIDIFIDSIRQHGFYPTCRLFKIKNSSDRIKTLVSLTKRGFSYEGSLIQSIQVYSIIESLVVSHESYEYIKDVLHDKYKDVNYVVNAVRLYREALCYKLDLVQVLLYANSNSIKSCTCKFEVKTEDLINFIEKYNIPVNKPAKYKSEMLKAYENDPRQFRLKVATMTAAEIAKTYKVNVNYVHKFLDSRSIEFHRIYRRKRSVK